MASTPTLKSSGTQTATLDTDHYLLSTSDNGVYVLIVNCTNMAAGDIVEFKIWLSSTSGGITKVAYYTTHGLPGANDVIKISVPVPAYHGANFTLNQTDGTGRSYQWEVLAL